MQNWSMSVLYTISLLEDPASLVSIGSALKWVLMRWYWNALDHHLKIFSSNVNGVLAYAPSRNWQFNWYVNCEISGPKLNSTVSRSPAYNMFILAASFTETSIPAI
jgi:hypothetical protein